MALKERKKVLVTLGVIGVIGALVLPTLMQNSSASVSAKKTPPPPAADRPAPPPPPPVLEAVSVQVQPTVRASYVPYIRNPYSAIVSSDNKEAYNAFCFGPEFGNKCYITARIPKPITRAECNKLKSELGLGSCLVPLDYYAGAAKLCGGTKYIASPKVVAAVASDLYRAPGGIVDIGTTKLSYTCKGTNNSTSCRNNELAYTLGFGNPNSNSGSQGTLVRVDTTKLGSFTVYTNATNSGSNASVRTLNENNTTIGSRLRSTSNIYVMCDAEGLRKK